MAEIDSAPRLNAVSRDKNSASVRQADVPTKNLQLCDKKSASVRQQEKMFYCVYIGNSKLSNTARNVH